METLRERQAQGTALRVACFHVRVASRREVVRQAQGRQSQYKSVERCPAHKSSPKIGIWVLLNINLNPDSETLWTYLHTPLDILTIALSCHQYLLFWVIQ
ncbi:hypothetical protein [Nostoc sp.]|uniref:hypothetical protein n=1 Tax=Nostoc sp. TaxID=1180 RepID=UPI002FF7DBCF